MKTRTTNRGLDRTTVCRAIKKLGNSGRHFQSRDVREQLGIKTSDRRNVARIHNLFKSLKAERIVGEVEGGERKRHKYFKVLDPERLRQLTPWGVAAASDSEGRPSVGIPLVETLTRIESVIQTLDERSERLEGKIEGLVAMWQ
jgi:hypothetical protein